MVTSNKAYEFKFFLVRIEIHPMGYYFEKEQSAAQTYNTHFSSIPFLSFQFLPQVYFLI